MNGSNNEYYKICIFLLQNEYGYLKFVPLTIFTVKPPPTAGTTLCATLSYCGNISSL